MAVTCSATVTLSAPCSHSIVSLKIHFKWLCVAATPARSSWKTVSDGSQVSQDLPICAVPRVDWVVGCDNGVRRSSFVVSTTSGEWFANANPDAWVHSDSNAEAFADRHAQTNTDCDAGAHRDSYPDSGIGHARCFTLEHQFRIGFLRWERPADAGVEQRFQFFCDD